ncbi:MAG TPA: caspase family protein [Burkholderiales bacterium]|nr:caspase family protein [Burkholderiales bacterium]
MLLIVDCLLPGQVRRLGQRSNYLSARRPARLPARECQIRGGEYVAYDRADLRSALNAWLPLAEQGDVEARVIVGEIHERGLGVEPDHEAAARWYRLAADAGDRRAMVNLGYLYERGLGVVPDARVAIDWYRRAAGRDVPIELEAPPAAPDQGPDIERLQREIEQRQAATEALATELAAARAAGAAQQEALDAARREVAAALAGGNAERAILDGANSRLALATRLQEEITTQLVARERDLTAERTTVERLGRELTEAAELAGNREQRIAQLEQDAAQLRRGLEQKLLAGPELALVDPPMVQTRDIVPVATVMSAERTIVGRVTAPAGLLSLTINDIAVSANDRGVFSMNLAIGGSELPVRIAAVDGQGKRAELSFRLQRPRETPVAAPAPRAPTAPPVEFGNYHALVIGNDDYQHLPDLGSPSNDVAELAKLLEQRYGFKVTVLRNASRYQILSALNALRESLTPRDNLLVYFAGHGELDDVNQRGYWLPVDAERDSSANWIPTTAVTDVLNIVRAKHVMLVVDSCYAGALTRSSVGRLRAGMTEAERVHWLRTMSSRRTRTVLTSGGLAPVMDAGGGRHSVFAKALLDVLVANEDVLDGQRLHREVAARVAYAAANLAFDQVPEYAPIRHAGHEAGEFLLVPQPRSR